MKHPALRCAVAALLLSGVASAQAANDYWYAGLGVGYSRIHFFPSDFSSEGSTPTCNPCSDSKKEFDAGFKAFLGYQMNRNWAVEGSFVQLGKFQYKYSSGNVTQLDDYGVAGWGVSVLPTVPLTNNLSLYGRVGAFFSHARINFYNAGLVVGNNGQGVMGEAISWLTGFGVQYFFGGDNGFRVEYENYGQVGSACTPSSTSCAGRANAKMVSVNAIFKF